MDEKIFNIDHLLKLEQEGLEDLDSYPHEDRMDLSKLLASKRNNEEPIKIFLISILSPNIKLQFYYTKL